MKKVFDKMLNGYQAFRQKYVQNDQSIMQSLAINGQQPEVLVVSCCDSRVDPALILQCDPGDLFVVRNVANIVPPFENDDAHHGTSAALEFGVRVLNVNHLVILGHSQCGGIQALVKQKRPDLRFVDNWVSIIKAPAHNMSEDDFAKAALNQSKQNCLTFPWIKEKIDAKELEIHLWFFDIKTGRICALSSDNKTFTELGA